jgi:hypothetical protein
MRMAIRPYRPAPSSRPFALSEGGHEIEPLFTDLGLHEDLHAGLKAAQELIKRVLSLPVLYTTGQAITDGLKALFV